jgi:NSS family neurotransmitter:Na+ symporter
MGTFMSGLTAILFFITIIVAALSSAVSMMEVAVAYLVEEKHVTRVKATSGNIHFLLSAWEHLLVVVRATF